MDQTFDQAKPLDSLVGSKVCFSFDPKVATRSSLLFLFEVLQTLFDRSFASSVKRLSLVCFMVGQPLGYYSSWPLFALPHHLLACRTCVIFTQYAVLGDDIIITDEHIADMTRSAEFAKSFRVRQLTKDFSLMSIRYLYHSHHLFRLD
ncbi:RNA-dependent RNA polymerase mitoviral protein [Dioscorea alata]|uniref:RNA-dependent RNA polymerase mitoviral protein n=1 Tax=Dioscorea alata TaxID=55571 RepID=A0ACB7USI7_DIOAL|nr:RNA-dependent RNA polymerase mitoviral protein [Dioscorea alata]